jgi:hypothetical protein
MRLKFVGIPQTLTPLIQPMNNNPLHEDARCFYATSGLTLEGSLQ